MDPKLNYGRNTHQFSNEFIAEVTSQNSRKMVWALIEIWLSLALLIYTIRFLIPAKYFWVSYVPFIFLIAGRFGALLQLIHEGSHNLLSHSKKINDFVGSWLCAYPIGVNYHGYVRGHFKHHAFTNMEKDPKADQEKYRVVDARDPRLYLLFLKDFLGITALSIFFEYDDYEKDSVRARGEENKAKFENLRTLASMSVMGLLVLGIFFQFNLLDYVLLWLVPAVSPHMFLMRVRGIAEHGAGKQLGVKEFDSVSVGTYYTRSFTTPAKQYDFKPFVWAERLLIGSLNVYYHHEHHLLPNVPFYHLSKVHRRVNKTVMSLNPEAYSKGYFAAAFLNWREGLSAKKAVFSPSH